MHLTCGGDLSCRQLGSLDGLRHVASGVCERTETHLVGARRQRNTPGEHGPEEALVEPAGGALLGTVEVTHGLFTEEDAEEGPDDGDLYWQPG